MKIRSLEFSRPLCGKYLVPSLLSVAVLALSLPSAAQEQVPAAAPPETPSTNDPLAVQLEMLPASAYPRQPKTGIKGGSLALSILRQQWPYLPRKQGQPRMRVGVSGNIWVDSNFRQIKAGLSTEDDQTEYRQQGRSTLRLTPTFNGDDGYFIQANTEFIANLNQDHNVTNYVDVDGAWLRMGKWKTFDVQVGRMQGFEVFHTGMGLDLNTYERFGAASFSNAPQPLYGLTDLWDYGVGNGAVAFHYYLPEWLRLEMLVRFGLSGQGSDVGMRPVGVIDLGWLKFKAGYERRLRPSLNDNSDARIETQGLAASLQFVLEPWVEFGFNAAHRVEDAFERDGAARPGASHTTRSFGGFVNVQPFYKDWLVGAGYTYTDWENFDFDAFGKPETTDHNQMFLAAQYMMWDKLYIKYVVAYSSGHMEYRNDSDIDDVGFDNKSTSHRLRLMMFY